MQKQIATRLMESVTPRSWCTVCASFAPFLSLVLLGCERTLPPDPAPNLTAAAEIRTGLGDVGGTGPSPSEEQPLGTGWATLQGALRLDGSAPPPQRVSLSGSDAAYCQQGGQVPEERLLDVDATSGGIANVLIYLRNARREHESVSQPGTPVVFDQKGCLFLKRLVGIRAGGTLDVRNSDGVPHNTNLGSVGFNSVIASGKSVPVEIRKATRQPIGVVCNIHPWMKAYLFAHANGYFAVTDAEGKFEIANLPAGESLEFQVWHELGAGRGGGIAVQEAPEGVEWDGRQGRFTLTLEPDEVRAMGVLGVPISSFRS